MLDLKSHLKSLVETHAPSGHEGPIRELIRDAWTPYVDRFEEDKLGSLIGIRQATQPIDKARRIMLSAHMDEIGLMVRDVVDGFIFVARVAGMDSRVMMAQPVMVHGTEPLPGLVAAIPPHMLKSSDRGKYPSFDDMVVDVGLPAEEVAAKVRIGDLITPDVPMIELKNGRLAAKSFDDRACVAAVTCCLAELQKRQHQWDVYAAATAQEESGLLGAKTAAYLIDPDIAIALDVTFASQPGVKPDEASELGGGPALALGPNFHPRLYERIQSAAQALEIKLQTDVIPGRSGTDAWSIQIAREGVPTALISIPLRNMHSPVETLDIRDVERTGRLLAHFITELDADFMAALDWQADDETPEPDKA